MCIKVGKWNKSILWCMVKKKKKQTNVSCLRANFIMVTVICIIAYIIWLCLYPCGLWPCNGSVESEINWNWEVAKLAYFYLRHPNVCSIILKVTFDYH